MEKKILDLLSYSEKPLGTREIANILNISFVTATNYVSKLLSEDKIHEIQLSHDRRYKVYVVNLGKINKEHVGYNEVYGEIFQKYYLKISEYVAEVSSRHDEKQKELQKVINYQQEITKNIYLNMITIMGVFVAIFAIITVNLNLLSQLNDNCWLGLLKKILIVNGSLISSIFIMFLILNYFIIRPLKQNENSSIPD